MVLCSERRRVVNLFLLIAATIILVLPQTTTAYQSYQTKIPNGDRVVRNGMPWPAVGHVTAAGGASSSRNTFGTAFASAGYTWGLQLCQEDSDGDGYSNGMELGDPLCRFMEGLPKLDPSIRTTSISHPGFADSVPMPSTLPPSAPPASSRCAAVTSYAECTNPIIRIHENANDITKCRWSFSLDKCVPDCPTLPVTTDNECSTQSDGFCTNDADDLTDFAANDLAPNGAGEQTNICIDNCSALSVFDNCADKRFCQADSFHEKCVVNCASFGSSAEKCPSKVCLLVSGTGCRTNCAWGLPPGSSPSDSTASRASRTLCRSRPDCMWVDRAPSTEGQQQCVTSCSTIWAKELCGTTNPDGGTTPNQQHCEWFNGTSTLSGGCVLKCTSIDSQSECGSPLQSASSRCMWITTNGGGRCVTKCHLRSPSTCDSNGDADDTASTVCTQRTVAVEDKSSKKCFMNTCAIFNDDPVTCRHVEGCFWNPTLSACATDCTAYAVSLSAAAVESPSSVTADGKLALRCLFVDGNVCGPVNNAPPSQSPRWSCHSNCNKRYTSSAGTFTGCAGDASCSTLFTAGWDGLQMSSSLGHNYSCHQRCSLFGANTGMCSAQKQQQTSMDASSSSSTSLCEVLPTTGGSGTCTDRCSMYDTSMASCLVEATDCEFRTTSSSAAPTCSVPCGLHFPTQNGSSTSLSCPAGCKRDTGFFASETSPCLVDCALIQYADHCTAQGQCFWFSPSVSSQPSKCVASCARMSSITTCQQHAPLCKVQHNNEGDPVCLPDCAQFSTEGEVSPCALAEGCAVSPKGTCVSNTCHQLPVLLSSSLALRNCSEVPHCLALAMGASSSSTTCEVNCSSFADADSCAQELECEWHEGNQICRRQCATIPSITAFTALQTVVGESVHHCEALPTTANKHVVVEKCAALSSASLCMKSSSSCFWRSTSTSSSSRCSLSCDIHNGNELQCLGRDDSNGCTWDAQNGLCVEEELLPSFSTVATPAGTLRTVPLQQYSSCFLITDESSCVAASRSCAWLNETSQCINHCGVASSGGRLCPTFLIDPFMTSWSSSVVVPSVLSAKASALSPAGDCVSIKAPLQINWLSGRQHHQQSTTDGGAATTSLCYPNCELYSGSSAACGALASSGCEFDDANGQCRLNCQLFSGPYCPQGCGVDEVSGFCQRNTSSRSGIVVGQEEQWQQERFINNAQEDWHLLNTTGTLIFSGDFSAIVISNSAVTATATTTPNQRGIFVATLIKDLASVLNLTTKYGRGSAGRVNINDIAGLGDGGSLGVKVDFAVQTLLLAASTQASSTQRHFSSMASSSPEDILSAAVEELERISTEISRLEQLLTPPHSAESPAHRHARLAQLQVSFAATFALYNSTLLHASPSSAAPFDLLHMSPVAGGTLTLPPGGLPTSSPTPIPAATPTPPTVPTPAPTAQDATVREANSSDKFDIATVIAIAVATILGGLLIGYGAARMCQRNPIRGGAGGRPYSSNYDGGGQGPALMMQPMLHSLGEEDNVKERSGAFIPIGAGAHHGASEEDPFQSEHRRRAYMQTHAGGLDASIEFLEDALLLADEPAKTSPGSPGGKRVHFSSTPPPLPPSAPLNSLPPAGRTVQQEQERTLTSYGASPPAHPYPQESATASFTNNNLPPTPSSLMPPNNSTNPIDDGADEDLLQRRAAASPIAALPQQQRVELMKLDDDL